MLWRGKGAALVYGMLFPALCGVSTRLAAEQDLLTTSLGVELEQGWQRIRSVEDGVQGETSDPRLTLDLEVEAHLVEWLSTEWVVELESEGGDSEADLDEALVRADLAPWQAELGRLYVPFGSFDTRFVTGGLVEFGETRRTAMVVRRRWGSAVALAGYLLHSSRDEGLETQLDWGAELRLETFDRSMRVGFGYLSDVRESDNLMDGDFDRVPVGQTAAWDLHAVIESYPFEIGFEAVAAGSRLGGIEMTLDQPRAQQIEAVWYPIPDYLLALRAERSRELVGAPESRLGLAAAWAPDEALQITLEVLSAEFPRGQVFGETGEELSTTRSVTLEVAWEW